MNYQVYLTKSDINDATSYYIYLIKKAIVKNNDSVNTISDIRNIDPDSIVVVANAKSHFKVLLRNRQQKTLCWYQGVMPEELAVNYKRYDKYLKILLWTFFERTSLRNTNFSLFVSESMKQHYGAKYGYVSSNNYVMPCFNSNLNKDSFLSFRKYEAANFVYAGSMSKWQCIEEMLTLYKIIEREFPKVSLTILTSDRSTATQLTDKYNIKNLTIDYVSYNNISTVLSSYKYGFILRDDITMNRVATPTKMNTYLANGIIPIYSDCVQAFRENLYNLQYQIVVRSYEETIGLLKRFESFRLDPEDVYQDFLKNAFSKFYSARHHVNKLAEKLYLFQEIE